MASQSQDQSPRQRFEILRRAEQPFIAIVCGMAVAACLGYWTMRYVNRDRLIEIDRAAPLNAEFKVDINTASWPEIVVLPDVGEATARAIVAERAHNGPYTDLEDLAHRVHGVGPRMLEQISPYILPCQPPAALATDAKR
jgi:competence ComEA-like helix-hairpin-helix protein